MNLKWSNCIYVNTNPSYNLAELDIPDGEYIVKIGSSKCLPARYNSYKTYSPIATQILHYYYIQDYDCYQLDDDIKYELDNFRIHSSGGIEFYYSSILEHLENYFQSRKIAFTKYEDISDFTILSNENRISLLKQIQEEDLEKASRKLSIKPSCNLFSKFPSETLLDKELIPHQKTTLLQMNEHYKTQDKGILNLFCRYGKTRMSSLFTLVNDYKKILVLVPSLYLVKQTYKTWKCYFNSEMIIKVSSTSNDISNIDEITKKYNTKHSEFGKCIIISTYHSSYKLADLNFDLAIFDEAHRTTGDESDFNKLIHSSNITKKLFLTATMKYYNYQDTEIETIRINSMNNTTIYGDIIASVSASQALKLQRICPYTIMTVKLQDILECGSNMQRKRIENLIDEFLDDDSQKDDIVSDGVRDFISDNKQRYIRIAYGLIQVIRARGIQHLITFHRFIACAKLFKFILEAFLDDSSIQVSVITGTDDKSTRDNIIDDFQKLDNVKCAGASSSIKSKILCNARVLQEGVDIPKCDAVAFVDLKSSAVDTVQALARCMTYLEDKQAYILIPFDESDFQPLQTSDACSASDIKDSESMLDIKLSSYALNLRLILRNLIEIDDNIKEYFRNYIARLIPGSVGLSGDSSFDASTLELVKCLVDEKVIIEMSEIVYEVFQVAKTKIKGRYATPEEYSNKVLADFGNDLPANPDIVYRKWGWHGWNDYLGIDPYMTLSQVRKVMRQVNLERAARNEKMITSKSEYQAYAKDNNMMVFIKLPYENWCWLLLPDYDDLVEKYYKTKEEIQSAIRQLGIKSIKDYETMNSRDSRLAPYELLQNGFYNERVPEIKNFILFLSSLYKVIKKRY